jgi:allantoate deiminase
VAVKYTIPRPPGKTLTDFMTVAPGTAVPASDCPSGNPAEEESLSAARLAAEILQRCEALGNYTEVPGQITRPFLCPSARDVHKTLSDWMNEAGCSEIHTDAIGNLIGQRKSAITDASALVIGSHLDTVPNAGRYDGILGVLLGIAVVKALQYTTLPFTLEVVGFSEEEGVRFGTPYLGSRAYTGNFEASLLERRDAENIMVADAIQTFGLDPMQISDAIRPAAKLLGYIEAHIEQGPILERENQTVGVVTAIVGQSRLLLRFTGQAGHGGTTPMRLRHDALTGSAEFILAVEVCGQSTPDLVATVGRIHALPGTGNVIPGDVELSLDVRHPEDSTRWEAIQALCNQAGDIAARRGLKFAVINEFHQPAVPMDSHFCARLADAVESVTQHPCPHLISGAGHDAAILAPHTPSALLFLRSPKAGLSHHPDEAVEIEDIEIALRTLVAFVLRLADDVIRPIPT